MRQGLGDGDGGLATRGKLRPEIGNRGVIIKQTTIDQPGDDEGRDCLAGGIDRHERFGGPFAAFLAIRPAAMQIDHEFAIKPHRETGADFVIIGPIGDESIAHGFKTGRNMAVNGGN